jgi:hypothetical protein
VLSKNKKDVLPYQRHGLLPCNRPRSVRAIVKSQIMSSSSTGPLKLYVGIDVHKKQWSVSIFTEAAHHRTFCQPPSPEALKAYVDKSFPNSIVTCAYEATELQGSLQ